MEQSDRFGAAMKIEVLDTEEAVAERAASIIAEVASEAAAVRGRFAFAVSGGRTPWVMLSALSGKNVHWPAVHVFQVDERVAPRGDPDRNFTHLTASFLAHAPLRSEQVHAMPVESPDLAAATKSYSDELRELCGAPPVLDLAHLGLGPDGHTASLVPGDPVLDVIDRDVGVTDAYQGRRRMTLTYPVLNAARQLLWVVTGEEKAEALARLLSADPSIPGGRLRQSNARVIADQAAAGQTTLTAKPYSRRSSPGT
jgi:6-phosphogluconolactonase